MKSLFSAFLVFFLLNSPVFAQQQSRNQNTYDQAMIAFENENWELAESLLAQWISDHPGYTEAYWFRGQAFEQLGNYNRALSDFSSLLTLDPNYAEGYFARGRARYQLGQYEEAMVDFKKFLILPAGETSRILYRISPGEKGVSQITTAQTKNPAQVYYHLGLYSMELEEYAQAIDYYNLAIRYQPIEADFYVEKGKAYSNMAENDLAIEAFEKALELESGNLPAKQGLAIVNRGGDQELLHELTLVIEDSAANSQTYKQRGFYRMSNQDSEGALIDFSAALALDSTDMESYFYRGKLYSAQEKWPQAETNFSKAIELDPQNPDFFLGRGQARYRKGELDGALADFILAVSVEPQYATGYYHQGITYQRMGKTAEACPQFQKAKELGMVAAKEVWEKVCSETEN